MSKVFVGWAAWAANKCFVPMVSADKSPFFFQGRASLVARQSGGFVPVKAQQIGQALKCVFIQSITCLDVCGVLGEG